jgi:hypothetical protein
MQEVKLSEYKIDHIAVLIFGPFPGGSVLKNLKYQQKILIIL